MELSHKGGSRKSKRDDSLERKLNVEERINHAIQRNRTRTAN